MKKALFSTAIMAAVTFGATGQENYGNTPEQQRECMEALSVYRSFRDQENLKDAYTTWQTACKVCPVNVSERLYSDGVRFVKEEFKMAQQAKAQDRMKNLIDSLFWSYDMRMTHFAATDRKPLNRCEVLAFKASDWVTYRPAQMEEALKMFKESIDCLKENSSATALSGYYITLHKLIDKAVDARKRELRETIISDYLMIIDYCDFGINNSDGKSKEGFEKAKFNVDEIFVLFAQCDDMMPILKEKRAADPGNIDLLKKSLKLMNKKDCSDDPVYLKWAEELLQIEPGHEAAYSIGMGYLKKNDLGNAQKYLDQAVELGKDSPDLPNYLLKAGQVASANKNLNKARQYANRLIQMGKNIGEAYILLGDCAAGQTGCDDGFGGRSIYWVACDYYETARSKDSSVSDKAAKKISQTKTYWPKKADVFTQSLGVGEKFHVDCLGADTIIRVAD
jgi:hypothetical protein